MIHDHEHQPELDLWEHINFKPFADIKAKQEEYESFRNKIAQRILTLVEEVYGVIDNPYPTLVWQVLGEELAPILQEWKDFKIKNV